MKQEIPWNRFAVETFVIVGSILLAFAIDALWGEFNDDAQGKALLNALAEDLQQSSALLAISKRDHQRILETSKLVLDYGEIGTLEESQKSDFENAVGRHFLRTIYSPPLGTIESLLSSGRLDLIDNPNLVPALNQWVAQVDVLAGTQAALRENFYERIYPYLAPRIDLEDLDKGFANYVEFPWNQIRTGAYELVDDREFLSMIYMHWVLSQNCLASLRDVEDQLTKLLNLIQESTY
jgi:hypothetical protein